MTAIAQLTRLYSHLAWADSLVRSALERQADHPPEALREYAHVLGAEETWLARVEGRAPRCAVWPVLTFAEAAALSAQLEAGYTRLIATLDDAPLTDDVSYVNSMGHAFTSALGDILLHVALHGQYHRGKANLLLRQAGHEPAPLDFITFVRGGAGTQHARPK